MSAEAWMMIIAIVASVSLVALGFLIGSLVPAIIRNAQKTDMDVLRIVLEESHSNQDPALEGRSEQLEKTLYNLELKLACAIGEHLELEMEQSKTREGLNAH